MSSAATLRLWTNAHDTACQVRPGPGGWHRCQVCGTRWRPIGRWVRRTTRGYRCPGCAQVRQARRQEATA